MLPSHVDSGFHIVGEDDELGRPPVIVAAKAHDVDLSHGGRENSEKLRGEQVVGLKSHNQRGPGQLTRKPNYFSRTRLLFLRQWKVYVVRGTRFPMIESPDQLVTIVGSSYFQPISDLLSRLMGQQKPGSNEVQTSSHENGYCASLVLLLVTMLESYVMRVRYINRDRFPIKRIPVADYLPQLYPDYQRSNELTEIFVVRDVIAHNHLWEIDFAWSEESVMTLLQAEKESTAGDEKYKKVVNKQLRTNALDLNILPTKVDRTDVFKVFDIVWETLIFLESKNRNQCYVSHLYVRFNGQTKLFGELRDELRNAL